ncbi:MAG: hypothetical protein U1E17_00930 [Geminicoccaceae bacterium]
MQRLELGLGARGDGGGGVAVEHLLERLAVVVELAHGGTRQVRCRKAVAGATPRRIAIVTSGLSRSPKAA